MYEDTTPHRTRIDLIAEILLRALERAEDEDDAEPAEAGESEVAA